MDIDVISVIEVILVAFAVGGGSVFFFTHYKPKKKPEVTPILGKELHEAPNKIDYEIVKEADSKLVVTKSGTIKKSRRFLDNTKEKRRYFPDHILVQTLKSGKKRFLVRWNYYYSESLKSIDDLMPAYSPSLESLLSVGQGGQFEKALGVIGGFALDRPTLLLLGVAVLISIPIGIGLMPSILNPPNTVVHWYP